MYKVEIEVKDYLQRSDRYPRSCSVSFIATKERLEEILGMTKEEIDKMME